MKHCQKLYYNLSFEFDYRVLSEKENKIHFCGSEYSTV
jgi:hypothetical protein